MVYSEEPCTVAGVYTKNTLKAPPLLSEQGNTPWHDRKAPGDSGYDEETNDVEIDMTLTAPGCPVAGEMPTWVENAVKEVDGINGVRVNLVFDPPWDMSRMSDEARVALNLL